MAINRIIFPQADSINKIIDMIINFDNEQLVDREYFVRYFDVVPRQYYYYFDALVFLGILDIKGKISPLGIKLREFDDSNDEICHILRNAIVNKPVFKQVYEYFQEYKKFPENKYISELITEYYKLSASTSDRRTTTVKKWIKWANDVIWYKKTITKKWMESG